MSGKIIVMTPAKNEDWILHQFLSATSRFADAIIVADQNSTDRSREICSQFEKVVLVKNESQAYSESERQFFLIDTARKLFPNDKRILFGLDADEIIVHSQTSGAVWDEIRDFPEGTTLMFEKPDVLPGSQKCIRWKSSYFPLGYVDDGIAHEPKEIHSRRIPFNPSGIVKEIGEIKFLHFAITRRKVQSAKMRFYSMIENIKGTKPAYVRRRVYKSFFDYNTQYPGAIVENVPQEWLKDWNNDGVNLVSIKDPDYSWHDYEVLEMFSKYGSKQFFLDDIWKFDWNKFLEKAHMEGKSLQLEKIETPGLHYVVAGRLLDLLDAAIRIVKKII